MPSRFRTFSKRFLLISTLLLVILFSLTALIPYANPTTFPWLGFAGLAFPYLLVLVIFFLVFWLIFKPAYSIIPIIAIALCWKQVSVLFRISKASFNFTKSDASLRIMSWNVKVFEGIDRGPGASAKASEEIISFIKASQPDIICLQEFNQYDSMAYESNHIKRMMDAGYPYYIFSSDYKKKSIDYHSGVAIFSRTPLSTQQKIAFNYNPESIVFADVVKGKDTFRIFTTHLQSFKFSKDDYRKIDELKSKGDVSTSGSKNLVMKMKRSFEFRGIQSQQIRPLLDHSPYPEVICGDFNDVPNSFTYWQIRGNRRDAFIEKGKGIGRTFASLAPTLRIDYIFCNKRLTVDQFVVAYKPWSDHMPLIADIRLEKKP